MLTSASSYYRRQRSLNALAVRGARNAKGRGPEAVAAQVQSYQAASVALADTAADVMLAEQGIDTAAEGVLNAPAFVSSSSGLVQMIRATANDVALDRLVSTLVADAGRSGMGVATVARPGVTGHIRYVNSPSCARCAILAGRFYRWSTGFQRHPHCDCQMVPSNEIAAPGLISDPMEAFEKGQISGLSKADTQAIIEGADLGQVVNVRRSAAGLTEGSSVMVRGGRLTPEGVYRIASDRAEAVSLLTQQGYITRTSRPLVAAPKTAAEVAESVVAAARVAEPELTALTSGLAEKFGGRMEGLDFRLKTADSLARKLEGEILESGGTLTAEAAAAKMFDVNRYTTVYSESSYADGVQASLDSLRADGHTLKVKNYWNVDDNPYQGVNVQIISPAGEKFELQFHTDYSLEVKEGELHRIYELQRVETSAAKREEYAQQMFDIAAKIPVPRGILGVS